jgi:hypothetical protein
MLYKVETYILRQIPSEQQNRENNNTRNDIFIDGKPCSLDSSRGKPPTKKSSITIILKIIFSHAFYVGIFNNTERRCESVLDRFSHLFFHFN